MSTHDIRGPVVVGATHSEASHTAVAWAAQEAGRRHLPLRLIHVQEWPAQAASPGRPGHPSNLWKSHFHALGTSVLESGRYIATQRYPDLEIRTELVEGRPVKALREAAEGASLLVLGGRRPSEIEEIFAFGGTGASLAGHPPCPVALVLSPFWADETNAAVVVGVDGSTASEKAVALAFEEAELQSVELVAIEARRPGEDFSDSMQESFRDLSEALAGWGEKYPGVRARHEVVVGNPALALVRAAARARCLVVGSRGRGGFRGMVLGSTSRTLVHHTPCPLIVVPPEAAVLQE